jgi:hypothetical protein
MALARFLKPAKVVLARHFGGPQLHLLYQVPLIIIGAPTWSAP